MFTDRDLDETYDEILRYYSGSSYYLSAGVYKGKKRAYIINSR